MRDGDQWKAEYGASRIIVDRISDCAIVSRLWEVWICWQSYSRCDGHAPNGGSVHRGGYGHGFLSETGKRQSHNSQAFHSIGVGYSSSVPPILVGSR